MSIDFRQATAVSQSAAAYQCLFQLEQQLQCQLHGSGAAYLVERILPAASAARAEATGQHLRRVAGLAPSRSKRTAGIR